MMGSNDGFLHLKRKERKKLPRYRSGTWKHHAMKRLKGAYVKDSVEAFHDIDHRNVVVSFGGSKTKALAVSGPVFDRDLCRLDDDHEHTWVLINAGHGGFLRVSRKSYVKLCRIDRVYMQQRLFVKGDEDEDGHEVYRNVWPKGLDLEDAVYRPALRGLSLIGAAFARTVETLGALLVLAGAALIVLYFKAKKRGLPVSIVGGVILVVLGILVALALEQFDDGHLLVEQHRHQPFQHAIVGLVAQHALRSPVESYVLVHTQVFVFVGCKDTNNIPNRQTIPLFFSDHFSESDRLLILLECKESTTCLSPILDPSEVCNSENDHAETSRLNRNDRQNRPA